MSIDQTNKRRDVVSRYVAMATNVDRIMDEIVTLDNERLQCGVFDDASFTGNEHIAADDLATLATRLNALRQVVDAPYARDILRKARRGG